MIYEEISRSVLLGRLLGIADGVETNLMLSNYYAYPMPLKTLQIINRRANSLQRKLQRTSFAPTEPSEKEFFQPPRLHLPSDWVIVIFISQRWHHSAHLEEFSESNQQLRLFFLIQANIHHHLPPR